MKYHGFIILFILSCYPALAAIDENNNDDPNGLNTLAPRIHRLLDKFDSACEFVHELWKPFPKAISLSEKHPISAILCACSWAYLYKKDKKASYIFAGVIYFALYYRIKQNRLNGLAARGFLRNREALVIPDDPDLNT